MTYNHSNNSQAVHRLTPKSISQYRKRMMQTKTLVYFCTFALYGGREKNPKNQQNNFRLLKAVVLIVHAKTYLDYFQF